MDINLELAELIHKYHVDEFSPFFYRSCRAEGLAKKIYESLDDVVLVGTKHIDIVWFQRTVCGRDVTAILLGEENADEQLRKFENYKGVFLMISYYGRDEAMVRLLESGLHAVCLYEEFEKEGILFTDNFYDVYGEECIKRWSNEPTRDFTVFDINKIFFDHRRRFELETDLNKRRTALKKVIFDCVYAKDFLTLKKYIDVFQKQFEGEERERYLSFYKEVEKLLAKIKSALADRGQRDCIMIWLDELEYGEDEDMTFLHGLNDSSLVFPNVYTVTPHTSHTLKTIFAKRRPIEEESHKLIQMDRENSIFLAALEQHNYKFQYYGEENLGFRFRGGYIARHYYSLYYSFTQTYWDVIGDILKHSAEDSLFCVLHELFQTHLPFVSMGLTGEQYLRYIEWLPGCLPDEKIYGRQALESREYVDRQLEFFGGLLPDEMFKIYMSDHGHTFFGRYHCILKIQQKDLKPQICEDLLSWYDFDKLFFGLIDGKSVNELNIQNDYVVIQDTEYYGRDLIIHDLKKRKISPLLLNDHGFQGVVTKVDLFMCYNDGRELYQKICNDECMVTDERLEYMRGITSRKRIDLSTEEKFRYSRLLQQIVERCRTRTAERQEEKLNIIRNVFAEIPEGKILALRGGGLSSLRLLMLLDENSRKKVRYVIDADKECYAGKVGVKVISVEEADGYQIEKVIISSFGNRYEWKKECVNSLKAEVVDLYDIFEQHGIECQEDFCDLEYAEEDFEGIDV